MGMENNNSGGNKCFPTGWSVTAKLCDYCKSIAAVLFCRTDSIFFCMDCDVKAHAATTLPVLWRHERVWMCEVCEHAPASVTCKADAAALCITCDVDIHSANPLARRHERYPVVPFYDTPESVVKVDTCVAPQGFDSAWMQHNHTNPKVPIFDANEMKSIEYLLSGSDQFADFDSPVPVIDARFRPNNTFATDSVVPVQPGKPPVPAQMIDHSQENHFKRSNINSYSNNSTAQTLSHSVSSSSFDVGIVPDGSSVSDISYPIGGNLSNGADLKNSIGKNQQPAQLSGVDREARVLRYREKRKNRKFQKTIRYASRKAYAETRPRIKGRFAKRTELEAEVDWIFGSDSTVFMADAVSHGLIQSF